MKFYVSTFRPRIHKAKKYNKLGLLRIKLKCFPGTNEPSDTFGGVTYD